MNNLTDNRNVLAWLEETKQLLKPDKTVWIDGSEGQLEALRKEALEAGEITKLNDEKLPECYLYKTVENDVARVEERTIICTEKKEDGTPISNWMNTSEMKEKLLLLLDGVMAGRTMYIIPFCMGPLGSPFSKVGIEVTDSIYVVLSMEIMTRMGVKALDQLGSTSNDFVRCVHSKATVNPEERYIAHFVEENTIWSINSAYPGNAMLSKKSFALRIASYQASKEGWLAEHMLILGIESPDGKVEYIAAAFPSACGKTNLAMLIPPEYLAKQGYKVWTVGDDIAWLHIGKDGRLYAINPENGFFGVAPGTNEKSNKNALISTYKHTIFTNVAHKEEDNTVWWEGLTKEPPEVLQDWKGNHWEPRIYYGKAAHPNSRFTSPAKNCPCISKEFDNPEGVPISAIVFGGRRAKTAPLVYEAFDWQHGVYVGSTMASETTAAAAGAVGVTRRDPMAMRPFTGYNMGDYFNHWLKMGKKMGDKAPKIFHVNWFKTSDQGKFIWPGFGDNMRVLMWIIDRCNNKAEALQSEIGYLPHPEDIDITDLKGITIDTVKELLSVDKKLWLEDVDGVKMLYYDVGAKLPSELRQELENFEERLRK